MSDHRRVGQATGYLGHPLAGRGSCPTLQFLLLGDTSRLEFREACAALEEVSAVVRFGDVDSATAALSEGALAPHGIVLAQSHPGQFAPAAIERLRAAAPLARLIALAGNWCEGEPRSGRPLPGMVRIYWHEAAVRFRRELPRCSDAEPAWALPATATEEDRLLASVTAPLPSGERLVAIWSRRREMAELLADACGRAGYATVWGHPRRPCRVKGALAAVFDGDALDGTAFEELKRLSAQVAPARVLVLLGSPRTQELRLAATLGAAVIGKPFRVDELLWQLGRMKESR